MFCKNSLRKLTNSLRIHLCNESHFSSLVNVLLVITCGVDGKHKWCGGLTPMV